MEIIRAGGSVSRQSTKYLVATRGAYAAQGSDGKSDGTAQSATSRTRHVAPVACSDLELIYLNSRFTAEIPGDNDITVKAVIEAGDPVQSTLGGSITSTTESFTVANASSFPAPPFKIVIDTEVIEIKDINRATNTLFTKSPDMRGANGTTPASHTSGTVVRFLPEMYPVNFNGSDSVTIKPRGSVVGNVGVDLPAGAVFYVRTYVSVATLGQFWPVGIYTQGPGEGEVAGSDVTQSTTAWSQNFKYVYSPLAINGTVKTPKPTFALLGDSIMWGSGDTNQFDGGGFMQRAINLQYAYTKFALSGEQTKEFMGKGRMARVRGLQGVTHVISNYGTNDIGISAASVAQIQSYILDIATALSNRGIKVYWCTLTPRTQSTDSFVTEANQTVQPVNGPGGTLDLVNQWLRTIPAPLAGIIDIHRIAESSPGSFKWKPNWTGDGTHPNATGAAGIAAGINMSQFTL